MANTSSDKVSDTIVAPTVTTMGSSPRSPSFATMVEPEQRVRGEQRSDDDGRQQAVAEPEGRQRSQQQRERGRGHAEPIDRRSSAETTSRSISSPAKNISNSMPSSEKNSATGCSRGKTSSTCGPSTHAAQQQSYRLRQPDAARQARNDDDQRHAGPQTSPAPEVLRGALCRTSRSDMRAGPGQSTSGTSAAPARGSASRRRNRGATTL